MPFSNSKTPMKFKEHRDLQKLQDWFNMRVTSSRRQHRAPPIERIRRSSARKPSKFIWSQRGVRITSRDRAGYPKDHGWKVEPREDSYVERNDPWRIGLTDAWRGIISRDTEHRILLNGAENVRSMSKSTVPSCCLRSLFCRDDDDDDVIVFCYLYLGQ